MDALLESIRKYGVQVPVSVYREKGRYVLIDGERRWRCVLKLNLKTIPALVQERPTRLTNILLMFNIHALREQWDLLTIALKLRDVIALIQNEGISSTEGELSQRTGLSRGIIRRCHLLLNLPDKYKNVILEELQKPKRKQKLTEDFFIEMERSLKTVERAMPDVIQDKERVRSVLIQKFRTDIIPNRVLFRDVAKIARARNVDSDPDRAKEALKHLFSRNSYTIKEAYEDSVSDAYSERDVLTRLDALIERLSRFKASDIDKDIRQKLLEVIAIAKRLLE